MYDNNNQNNIEWYRLRLGNITGSAVGNIMGTPRSKSEEWTSTAQSYLNMIAFERTLNPIVVQNDDLFSEYLSITEVHSKILDWGHKMEGEAAHLFATQYYDMFGNKEHSRYELELQEPSSVKCEDLSHFASSPDRTFYDPETGEFCCIEIKCPQGNNFAKYVKNIFAPITQEERLDGLKKADSNYYYQCYAHMLATGASKTYFVVYNPFQTRPLNALCIERDEEVLNAMRDKIIAAEAYIESVVDNLLNK